MIFLEGLDEMEMLFALLALCMGNPQVTGEFPIQRHSYDQQELSSMINVSNILVSISFYRSTIEENQ